MGTSYPNNSPNSNFFDDKRVNFLQAGNNETSVTESQRSLHRFSNNHPAALNILIIRQHFFQSHFAIDRTFLSQV